MPSVSLARRFAQYVSFNVVGMLGISFYILADTFFIANGVGTEGLAALNFAIVPYLALSATGMMIGMGAATKFQIYLSRDQEKQARQCFSTAIVIDILVAVIGLLVGVVATYPLCVILGATGDTFELTGTYIRTIFSFAPFFLLNHLLIPFVRNDKKPKLVMVAMLVSSLANIVLDYVFIYIFNMGIFGAAFATGASPIISIAILLTHVLKGTCSFLPLERPSFKKYAGSIVSLGLSAFIVEISSGVLLFAFNLMIVKVEGTYGVAAYGVIANLAFVATALFEGIAQAIQPLASEIYARNKAHDLKRLAAYSFGLGLVLAALINGLALAQTQEIVAIFNRDQIPELTALACEGMHIYFWGYFFAGFNIVAAAFLSAVECARQAWVISLLRGLVATLFAAIVLEHFFGMQGIWLAFPVGEAISFVVSLLCMGALVRPFAQSNRI